MIPCLGVDRVKTVVVRYEDGKQDYLHLRKVRAFNRDDTNLLLNARAEASSVYTSSTGVYSPGKCVDDGEGTRHYCHTRRDVEAFFRFYLPTQQTCVTSIEVITVPHEDRLRGAAVELRDANDDVLYKSYLDYSTVAVQKFSMCPLKGPLRIEPEGGRPIENFHITTTATHLEILMKAPSHTAMAVFPKDVRIQGGADFIRHLYGADTTHTVASVVSNYDPTNNPSSNLRYNDRCAWEMSASHDRFCGPPRASEKFGSGVTERSCTFKICKGVAASDRLAQMRTHCHDIQITLVEENTTHCRGGGCMMVQHNDFFQNYESQEVLFKPTYPSHQAVLQRIECANPSAVTAIDCKSCAPFDDGRSFKCLIGANVTQNTAKVQPVTFLLHQVDDGATVHADGQVTCPNAPTSSNGDGCVGTMTFTSVVLVQAPSVVVHQLDTITTYSNCPAGKPLQLVKGTKFAMNFRARVRTNLLLSAIFVRTALNELINILPRATAFNITSSHAGVFNTSTNGVTLAGGEVAVVEFGFAPFNSSQLNGNLSITTEVAEFPLHAVGQHETEKRSMATLARAGKGNYTNVTQGFVQGNGASISLPPEPTVVIAHTTLSPSTNGRSDEGTPSVSINVLVGVVVGLVVLGGVVVGVAFKRLQAVSSRTRANHREPTAAETHEPHDQTTAHKVVPEPLY